MASAGNTVLISLWVLTGVCLFAHFSSEIADFVPGGLKVLAIWRSAIVEWVPKAAIAYTAVYAVVLISSDRFELRNPFAIDEALTKKNLRVTLPSQRWPEGYDTVH